MKPINPEIEFAEPIEVVRKENTTESGAEFSADGNCRYKLWRIWNESLPKVMCIGLNPSKAGEVENDPTITNLKIALTKLGFGGFYMMNLFGWISSKPEDLLTCTDPIGENDKHLKEVELKVDLVIVCWGTFKQAKERIKEVLPQYPNAKCFGKNKDGSPWHPMYLMWSGKIKNPQLIPYN